MKWFRGLFSGPLHEFVVALCFIAVSIDALAKQLGCLRMIAPKTLQNHDSKEECAENNLKPGRFEDERTGMFKDDRTENTARIALKTLQKLEF